MPRKKEFLVIKDMFSAQWHLFILCHDISVRRLTYVLCLCAENNHDFREFCHILCPFASVICLFAWLRLWLSPEGKNGNWILLSSCIRTLRMLGISINNFIYYQVMAMADSPVPVTSARTVEESINIIVTWEVICDTNAAWRSSSRVRFAIRILPEIPLWDAI